VVLVAGPGAYGVMLLVGAWRLFAAQSAVAELAAFVFLRADCVGVSAGALRRGDW